VAVSRRRFLGLLGCAVGASVLGTAGVVGLDGRLRHKLEDEWAYADGPDLSLPSSGAHIVSGSYANDVFTGVEALRSLSARLDCGTLDPFYQATHQLSELMAWPHVAVFRPWATHTSGFWRAVAPAQMRFLAAACGVH
jgi:hypothetical protein